MSQSLQGMPLIKAPPPGRDWSDRLWGERLDFVAWRRRPEEDHALAYKILPLTPKTIAESPAASQNDLRLRIADF